MEWRADDYVENAAFVSRYGEEVLALLAPMSGEAILDLGCGEGELAEKIAQKNAHVTAIDASENMINAAQRRGLNAFVMSAEDMSFNQEFDAIFSNAALHWMKSSDKVIGNIHKALKPKGRFIAEMGGSGNVELIKAQIYKELDRYGLNGDDYNPWYFPSKDTYAKQLKQAGFTIDTIEQFARPTKLPSDISAWLMIFAEAFLADIPEAAIKDFIQAVKKGLADKLQDDDGYWHADYVRLRFCATKDD